MDLSKNGLKDRLARINAFDGQVTVGSTFNAVTNRTGPGRPSSGGLTREHAMIVRETGRAGYERVGNWIAVPVCPVCGSGKRQAFVHRLGLDFHRCATCSHVFQDPILSPDDAVALYSDDRTAAAIYKNPTQQKMDALKVEYGLDVLDAFAPSSSGTLLELGCGPGVFLKAAARRNWSQCIGIDANTNYADVLVGSDKLRFVQGDFNTMDLGEHGPYDAIAMWSVLEHIYSLRDFVDRLVETLTDDGVLFVLVPNVQSLATRLMRSMSPCFNWQHVSYFSPDSLRQLMASCGLDCVHMETVISEINNIKSYMSGEYPYDGYGDPDGLFEFITPEFIHSRLLGSRIIAVFRKKGPVA